MCMLQIVFMIMIFISNKQNQPNLVLVHSVSCVVCRRSSEAGSSLNDLHVTLEEVTRAVKSLIDMYCQTFHTEFRFESTSVQRGQLVFRSFRHI